MELTKSENLPKFFAEFLGTFILVSTVVFCVYGNAGIFAATAIAASLMVAVYIFGSVSGAHLNPAVSLAIWWGGQLASVELMLCYWLSQFAGALFAGLVGSLTYQSGADKLIEPGRAYSLEQAAFGEFLYTFMLCFTVLNCACTKCAVGNQYYGLAIGFVIIAGGYTWGGISGGAFNPAVLFGFNLLSSSMSSAQCIPMLTYVGAEFLGALFAASVWKVIRAEDFGGVKNKLSARCLAEFIGTFFLCFTVCTCASLGLAVTAWAAAATLMCMIYAIGNVSGAHLNPAVTTAVLMSGRNKITVTDAMYYWGSQFSGAVFAGALSETVLGASAGPVGPVGHFNWLSVFIAESVYTAILCFTVLSCLTTQPAEWTRDFFGLAIASCVTLGGFAIGGVSGGALNPAVAASIDVGSTFAGKGFSTSWLAYLGCEVAGSALATGAFFVARPDEYSLAKQSFAKSA